MKILYLLRHAKSSSEDPELKDFERPLAARGAKDVPVMAARFQDRGKEVDCIISSSANRAKTTARLFAESIGYDVESIISNTELYFAGISMFLKTASHVNDSCASAMLVGHNPAVTDFVNEMTNADNTDIENVPTCGLIELHLSIDSWADINTGGAILEDFDYPKKVV